MDHGKDLCKEHTGAKSDWHPHQPTSQPPDQRKCLLLLLLCCSPLCLAQVLTSCCPKGILTSCLSLRLPSFKASGHPRPKGASQAPHLVIEKLIPSLFECTNLSKFESPILRLYLGILLQDSCSHTYPCSLKHQFFEALG